MSTENPYQSPQVESEVYSEDPPGVSRYPTWRFIVLSLIAAPAVIGPIAAVLSNFDRGITLSQLIGGLSIGVLLIPVHAVACVSIVRYWKAPSRKRLKRPGAAGAGLVQGAIWALAILAIPSAFLSSCYPIGLATAMAAYPNESAIGAAIILGIVVGIICMILTGRLAYNLWLDALGRPMAAPDPGDDSTRPTLP